jgi:hypothetical protein
MITRLLQLQSEGFGNMPIRDTDGHEIIDVSRPDEELADEGLTDLAVHIEAEF